ncbi:tRNA-dihydrouridine(20) synthase [NAD(P)+]-like, partial [Saccostrea cucullata]|uniref:tRNA-dihydrouridine(20) synthase [NAD(P)+]-like n=1 Tax=Saccostrea cuccullata TaxID=36930 RepID=UPI002ED5007A
KDFSIKISPKLKLFEWTKSKNINKPVYITTERAVDRNFNCVLHLNNNEFTTPYWEKSKQLAEQASAAVATTVLDIVDGRVEEPSEQLEKCRVQWLGLKIDKNLINIDNGNQENCDKGKNSNMSQSAKRKCDTDISERNKKVCPDENAG